MPEFMRLHAARLCRAFGAGPQVEAALARWAAADVTVQLPNPQLLLRVRRELPAICQDYGGRADDAVGVGIFVRTFFAGDGLPPGRLSVAADRLCALPACAAFWAVTVPDAMIAAGMLPGVLTAGATALECASDRFTGWCEKILVPAQDGMKGERATAIRRALDAAGRGRHRSVAAEPLDVDESDRAFLVREFAALSDVRLPLTDDDRLFEPVWALAERLHLRNFREIGRFRPERFARCMAQALATQMNELWWWLPHDLRRPDAEGKYEALDRRCRAWLLGVGRTIERESTLHAGVGELTRANVLARRRIGRSEAGTSILASPRAVSRSVRMGVERHFRRRGLDPRKEDVPGEAAAVIQLMEADGLGSRDFLFTGRDGYVRPGPLSVRDWLSRSTPRDHLKATSLDSSGESRPQVPVGREPDPLEALAASEAARSAADVRKAFAAAVAARLAQAKAGSARWTVLGHAEALAEGALGLTQLARQTGFTKAALSEAWSIERKALRARLKQFAG